MSINYVALLTTCNVVTPRVAFQAPTFDKLVELLNQKFSDNLDSFLFKQDDEKFPIYGIMFSDKCVESIEIIEMYMCGTLKAGKYEPQNEKEEKFIDDWNLLYGEDHICNVCSRYVYIVAVQENFPLSHVVSGLVR